MPDPTREPDLRAEAGIYDRFAKELAERASRLPVGDGFSDGVALGPLIDTAAVEKVAEHVRDAVVHGADVLTGGVPHKRGPLFFQPTVLAGVTQEMLVAREETFGPITPLIRFSGKADVIRRANDTEFGLAGYLFSRDAERIWKVSAALEAGMVGINAGLISNKVGALRGHQAVRHRPGRLGLWHRGVPRDQVPVLGRRGRVSRRAPAFTNSEQERTDDGRLREGRIPRLGGRLTVMEFHHYGYVTTDPRVQPASGTGLDRPADLPEAVDVLIVGAGRACC